MDSTSGSKAPSDIKALVTASDAGSGLPDGILDAPTFTAGSGSTTQGSGNGWVPGGGAAGGTPPAGGGSTASDNPAGSGSAGGGGKTGHKGPGPNSTGGGFSGQTQNGPAESLAASDFSELGNLPNSLEVPGAIGGSQAVPEPSAVMLFVTALLGMMALKLRVTRKA